LAVPLGFIFGGFISRPIRKLHEGTEKIGEGNLDYKVDIKTDDEIEQLADAFNLMAKNLKLTTTSVDNLNKEANERKKVEQALREGEKKYRELFESSRDAIMILIPDKGFISGNAATIEIFRCKNEKEFTTQNPTSLSPKFQPDGTLSSIKAQEMIKIAMEKGSHFFRWTHKRLDGTEFFATVLLTRIEWKDKRILQATVRDITNEVRNQNAIKQAADEWQKTFDSISDFVFILDRDHNIVKANKSFIKALKSTPENVIGKKCYELLHKSDKPWPECPFEKTKESGKSTMQEVDDPNIGVTLLVSISPIFDNAGKLVGVVHIARDITERKKAENELKKANEELRKIDQLKSDFVSTVSHELRTPLSITKEGISLVLDKIAGNINEKQKKILNTSRDNIDRLARIINDLLDISKIEAGKLELKKESFNMNDAIKGLATFFREEAKKKGLELRLNLPKESIELYADPDKLKQVFINLIGNSLKFTQKGYIEVSARKFKDRAECSVIDTGKGIEKNALPKVFNKFEQFGRVAGPGEKGTGLGLSIVKGIVELHHGSISVESEAGKGAKFTFTLPIYKKG